MGLGLLACRAVLAGVFAVAGAAKLADLAGSRQAMVDFGVPARVAGVAGVVLPVCELVIAVALVPLVSARFAALAAGVLLLLFCAGIVNALVHGRAPDCHCFGQVRSEPAGWRTLARNAVLLALAGFVAVAGWSDAGVSATHWVTRVPAAWLVALCAGVVIVVLVGFVAWFCLQLLAQNGRTIARLETLEASLERMARSLGPTAEVVNDPGRLGAGLAGAGLAVGAPAPEFELEDVAGERRSLSWLLARGRRVLLVFSDSGCGPCTALMPALVGWQEEHRGQLEVVVVASGDRETNRAKAQTHGLELMLLQSDREVAESYEAAGTPTAVIIEPDGRIASPTVGGEDHIGMLVAQATGPRLAVLQHRAVPRNGDSRPAPDTARVGEPAPELVLSGLDGDQVALRDLYAERALAIFWNPGCGFCQRMLPELQAFEQDPPAGAPPIVVISASDVEGVREHALRSTVLLDPEGQAMGAFGAGGTPMGVLIEDGRIASHVAAGADAVFELIHTATVSPARNRNGR